MTQQQLNTLKALVADMDNQQDNYYNDGGNGTAVLNLLDRYINIINSVLASSDNN